MVDLARYAMAAKAGALRKLATLLATVVYLEAKSIDDCLDLLELLIVTELGRAEREIVRERAAQARAVGDARHHPSVVGQEPQLP
jgi:hypothetical protein